jgi:hypothetical protein
VNGSIIDADATLFEVGRRLKYFLQRKGDVLLAKLEAEEAEEASAQAAQATQVTQSFQTAQTALEPEPDEDECSVCLEIIPGRDRVQITKCKHSSFCQSCLWRLIQDDQKCPFCRGDLDEYHPLWKKMRLR